MDPVPNFVLDFQLIGEVCSKFYCPSDLLTNLRIWVVLLRGFFNSQLYKSSYLMWGCHVFWIKIEHTHLKCWRVVNQCMENKHVQWPLWCLYTSREVGLDQAPTFGFCAVFRNLYSTLYVQHRCHLVHLVHTNGCTNRISHWTTHVWWNVWLHGRRVSSAVVSRTRQIGQISAWFWLMKRGRLSIALRHAARWGDSTKEEERV